MLIKILSVFIVLCAVMEMSECERGYCGNCKFIPYRRIKRGKYFSGPPQRFYSRPPVSYPHIGAFSYTPPPGYAADNDPPYPGPGPYKVSKRPTNEGLGDEDINNIMKYLTKQDLDKIIEFANEKQREEKYNDNLRDFSNGYNNKVQKKREQINVYKAQEDDDIQYDSFKEDDKYDSSNKENRHLFKANVQEIDSDQKYIFKGPYRQQRPYEHTQTASVATEPTPNFLINVNDNEDSFRSSDPGQRILNKPLISAYTNEDINQIPGFGAHNINTNTKLAQEDYLPKPVNLREDDAYGSYTNNVPSVVKSESSYELKNVGDLPLMSYNSKLDTVSSYHVPHYTITTPTKYESPSKPQKSPIIEAAPHISAAKEQSDAHLKAVKIWSNKSKGTAYTLHDDGTLSLERPIRPRGNYGYP